MMGGKRVYEEENMKPLIVCMYVCMCVSVCAAAFSLYSENEEK